MNKKRAASLIFLFTGIYGLIFSIQLPLGQWKEPGPGAFPLCLSILLLISGILWFIRGKGEGGVKADIEWSRLIKGFVTPLKILGLTGIFILAMNPLGFLLASSLYTFLLFLWVSRYKLWTAMGLAIIIGTGSWYFFEKILTVQLPRGFLPL